MANKKAQFYLFVALILALSAYSLLSPGIVSKQRDFDFEEIYNNYIHEGEIVINQALYKNIDIVETFDNYTVNFIEYAKTKNTDFYVAYIIKEDNAVSVVNYLKSKINISSHNTTLDVQKSTTLNTTNNIMINYEGQDYNYTFSDEYVQFKALVVNN
ncbi:hypothetical protein GOV08_01735 [Candidatus Woesearchaeota archaeon]|nr:hypothetical protein [Candidatus Woesearchaeota archaeon]